MMIEDLVEKHAHARPGFQLAAYREVALPLFVVFARVIVLEQRPLSPIAEGCLRSLDAGLDDPNDISEFLGLPLPIIKTTLADLNVREYVNFLREIGADRAKILITEKGRNSLIKSLAVEPQERSVPLVYDPYLKKIVFVPIGSLSRKGEVRARGWKEVPLCGLTKPAKDDLDFQEIDKAQRRSGSRALDRELLAVRRIDRIETRYSFSLALYYKNHSASAVEIAFLNNGEFALEHERVFAELGGPTLLQANFTLEPPRLPEAPGLLPEDELLASAVNVATEATASEQQAAVASKPEEAPSTVSLVKSQIAPSARKSLTQRPLRCYEHRKFLVDALNNTRQRLLIVAPWINEHVVNDIFLNNLEALLRRGVKVHIGYGYTDESKANPVMSSRRQRPNITAVAARALGKLHDKYKENFELKDIGNTHRKILASDERFVIVGSFNWLSFKGSSAEPPIDELGVLLSDPALMKMFCDDALALIKDGYKHPKAK